MKKIKKVSGYTHTKKQLDDYANQNNPNNKAYKANLKNTEKQKIQKQKHTDIVPTTNKNQIIKIINNFLSDKSFNFILFLNNNDICISRFKK